MSFKQQKKSCLDNMESYDRSLIGSVDEKIKPLVDKINSKSNFYTTSSCSGRLLLQSNVGEEKKINSQRVYITHETISPQTMLGAVKSNLDKGDQIWLLLHSFMLHVCAKTVDDAKELLDITRKAGLKRSGIISFSDRIMIEIIGTDYLSIPIAEKGKLIVTDGYIIRITEIMNEKLEINHKRMKKFESLLFD